MWLRVTAATYRLRIQTAADNGIFGVKKGAGIKTTVAVTFDDVSGDINWYQDGVYYETDSTSQDMISSSNSWIIGEDPRDSSGFPYTGTIHDVKIYNRILSASEIEALYLDSDLPMPQEPIYVLPEEEEELNIAMIEQDIGPMFGQIPSGQFIDGLIFNWRGIESDEAVDESFSENHGTLVNNPVWVGDGLDFERDDSNQILFSKSINLHGTDIFTYVFTITPESIGDVLGLIDGGTGAPAYVIYSDGRQRLARSGVTWYSGGQTVLVAGRKYMVAVTYDPTDPTEAHFYTNGRPDGTNSTLANFTQPITKIGRYQPSNYFDGIIHDVKIYERALSASEIEALYLDSNLPMPQEPIFRLSLPEIDNIYRTIINGEFGSYIFRGIFR